jgi:hypothetical protein
LSDNEELTEGDKLLIAAKIFREAVGTLEEHASLMYMAAQKMQSAVEAMPLRLR